MTDTLHQWVKFCIQVAHTPASFYAGARKIIRPYHFTFPPFDQLPCFSPTQYFTMLSSPASHPTLSARELLLRRHRFVDKRAG